MGLPGFFRRIVTGYLLLALSAVCISSEIRPLDGRADERDYLISVEYHYWMYTYELHYDDEVPCWATDLGNYQGVMFRLEDFFLSPPYETELSHAEFWFYHHPLYPWGTDEFQAEVWWGEETAPFYQLDEQQALALHYSPTIVDFDPYLFVYDCFWVIVDTEQSAGGGPWLLADSSGNFTGAFHSFYSDDFIVWHWLSGSGLGLDTETWGCIKGLYR
ncbi:MAG: hypothetical protein AVO35_08720 [Candidatus Aegiribacteria sp. MLS_C]|nr:MAG: hypothetical protein AVO35_08720 [Candidatus Aegiribacteria sp. MLS_C]